MILSNLGTLIGKIFVLHVNALLSYNSIRLNCIIFWLLEKGVND